MLCSGVSSPASRSSLASVKIGEGSFSPGDALVESLLPRVRLLHHQSASLSGTTFSSSSSSSKSTSAGVSFGGDADASGMEVLPLCEHPAVRRAQDECATLLNGNDVSLVEDVDVKEEVVEIAGREAELTFACRCIFQYLVLFLKDMEHFVEISVDVLDDAQTYRQLTLTNARSLAKVEARRCQLPLVLGARPGWRHVCVDLHDLTRRAFGTKHVTTLRVRVAGHCRVLRVFFQDEKYGDAELPGHLTFLG